MRRARREASTSDDALEPPRQRRRAAELAPAAPQAAGPGRRVTRARAAAAAVASAAAGPRANRRLRTRSQAAVVAPAGVEEEEQEQQEEQQHVPEAADSGSEYVEGESSSASEEEESEDEGEDSDSSNERAAAVVREMGIMPPGADSEEAGESASESESEGEADEYEDEGYVWAPKVLAPVSQQPLQSDGVLAGGPDWDVVFDPYQEEPARARGAVPQRQPGDLELTAGVWAREQPDRRHVLYGAPLANCPKLLSRVLKMRRQPGQLLWRSELALTHWEWQYLKGVFAADRLRPLLQHGRRVLAPLPEYGFPQHFRPVDDGDQPLRGPYISRNGKPWNVGRQFFNNFSDGDDSGFIWADGVRAMEPETQESFREEMGGGLYGVFG